MNPDPNDWHERELLSLQAQANNALFESLAQVLALSDPGVTRKQDVEQAVILAHANVIRVAQDAVVEIFGDRPP